MDLLVFGGSGQVGAALLQVGKRHGHAIATPARGAVDICDRETVIRVVEDARPDVVINAAAYTQVDDAESEAELAFQVNQDGAVNVAMASAQIGCPLIHLSTDYVFDGANSSPYTELDRPNPLSVYGKSKLGGEVGVTQNQVRHIILRTSWVFSALGKNFVVTMRRLAASGQNPLRIVADQHGGPTSALAIANCITAILPQILERDFTAWGTYHFSGTPATTWHGFAQAIVADQADCRVEPIPTSEYPTPAARPKNTVLDCASVTRIFGVQQPDWRRDMATVLAIMARED